MKLLRYGIQEKQNIDGKLKNNHKDMASAVSFTFNIKSMEFATFFKKPYNFSKFCFII